MADCDPFPEAADAAMLAALRRGRVGLRDALLYVVGIQTGYRIGELLALQRLHVQDGGVVCAALEVPARYMKRKVKRLPVPLSPSARVMLAEWLDCLAAMGYPQARAYVFQSLRGRNRAINRSQARYVLNRAARRCGIAGKIATHSLRKTFAERLYNAFLSRRQAGEHIDPIRRLQGWLGHKSIASTEAYLPKLNLPPEDLQALWT